MLFFNFRSDRMRQICQTFGKIDGQFPFEVAVERKNLHITSMTQYKADFPFPVLFPQQVMDNVLAEWLAKKQVKQMHIAGKSFLLYPTNLMDVKKLKNTRMLPSFLMEVPKNSMNWRNESWFPLRKSPPMI